MNHLVHHISINDGDAHVPRRCCCDIWRLCIIIYDQLLSFIITEQPEPTIRVPLALPFVSETPYSVAIKEKSRARRWLVAMIRHSTYYAHQLNFKWCNYRKLDRNSSWFSISCSCRKNHQLTVNQIRKLEWEIAALRPAIGIQIAHFKQLQIEFQLRFRFRFTWKWRWFQWSADPVDCQWKKKKRKKKRRKIHQVLLE